MQRPKGDTMRTDRRAAGRIVARSDGGPVYSLHWRNDERTTGTAFSEFIARRAVDFELERANNGRVVRIHAGGVVFENRPLV